MPKQPAGYVFYDQERKSWIARVTHTDETGKRRNIKRQVENKSAGQRLLKKLLRELDDHGTSVIEGDKLTFGQVAEQYKKEKLIEPVYKGESKVAGLRSHVSQKRRLDTLVQHFSKKPIKAIRHADIVAFKMKRLTAPNKRDKGKELAVATVNRELQLLRAVLNYAKQQGWLIRNPFEFGEPLISTASEVKRDRILTREEEARLLNSCTGKRAHLRSLLITALDTGMRKGELLQLRWSDIDLAEGLIVVRATTTKTLTSRVIGMTQRVKVELQQLWANSPEFPDELVFGITDNFKRSFASVCKLAGVEGFRFHDTRHTAATRMIQAGMPPLQVMKITGHTQIQTFVRYINTDEQTAKNVATALDTLQVASNETASVKFIN